MYSNEILIAYNVFIKHLKQYNLNNSTQYEIITLEQLNKYGYVNDFLKLSRHTNDIHFILKYKHLGYSLDNIFVGNRKTHIEYMKNTSYKYCSVCNNFLDKSYFDNDSSKYDGLTSACGNCIITNNRTKDNLIRRMYNRQFHSSKIRNHPEPEYTLDWVKKWAFNQPKFDILYNEWVKSNFNKKYTPSIDRINFKEPYRKNNIQLLTWEENNKKSHIEKSKKGYQYQIFDTSINEIKKDINKMLTNKHLIICESPAKAKTLTTFLGNDYKVLASFGHIRDLPKSELGVDVNDNFKPQYIISPDKRKVIAELKRYIDKDTNIYLASDEDREGEAISWHLIPTLGIADRKPKRIVFHEITKTAILHALEHPRELDLNMVDAQQARRILDRIVGYKLSPLLWKKVKSGLSAGRVQSVTVKIIVDREREITSFIPEEYWKLKLDILSNPSFRAEFSKLNGKVIRVENEEQATAIKSDCDKFDYVLSDVVEKDSFRNPPPPFITSTLQQEASIKAGMSPKQTMSVAQKLYEGGLIPGRPEGLITYMRTDSLNLSQLALTACKQVITSEYGSEYALASPRVYKAKGNAKVAAQEAHEAIRPVDMSIKPSDVARHLDSKELRLYTLIWQRTLATQMVSAKVANTTYKIYGGANREYEFVAKGTKILFPGFMKAYTEGNDNGDDTISKKEKFLPNVPLNTIFKDTVLLLEQNFTEPQARYTEASLVKKMEQEGIGRPSTYASTLSTIISRGYIEIDNDKKLVPTIIANAVTNYLTTNFPDIVDLAFTANIETEFDKIAAGEIKWQDVMRKFYDGFTKEMEGKEGGDRVQYTEERILGTDVETGLDIKVKSGNYGVYIQVGDSNKEKKIKAKIAAVPKDVKFNDVTLDMALIYLTIPKLLGRTEAGHDVIVGVGRFGGYLKSNDKYYNLNPEVDNIYTIVLLRALDIIKEVDEKKAAALLWEKDGGKYGLISIINGHYGPYILRHGVGGGYPKGNFRLPKDMLESAIRNLTLEEVVEIIVKQENNPIKKKPHKSFKRK